MSRVSKRQRKFDPKLSKKYAKKAFKDEKPSDKVKMAKRAMLQEPYK